MSINEITLTEGQERALEGAAKYLKEPTAELFKIGGYAGTGKTTMLRTLLHDLNIDDNNPAVCAFTGKAAHVLRKKGLFNAATIHATIYDYNDETREFELKHAADLEHVNYFLIDEASMVSKKLYQDLLSFGLPIVAVGDPGQLEPVGDDINLMEDCNVTLEEVLRQVQGNPIIQLATTIRKGAELTDCKRVFDGEDERVQFLNKDDVDGHWQDIILCAFNRTRHALNHRVRHLQGRTGILEPEEPVIILQNDARQGIFNGMILEVVSVETTRNDEVLLVEAKDPDMPGSTRRLRVAKKTFGQDVDSDEKYKMRKARLVAMDYAYAITCHKSQGSEWDKVLVVDEQCELWDAKRWRYTAITRAAEAVQVVM